MQTKLTSEYLKNFRIEKKLNQREVGHMLVRNFEDKSTGATQRQFISNIERGVTAASKEHIKRMVETFPDIDRAKLKMLITQDVLNHYDIDNM